MVEIKIDTAKDSKEDIKKTVEYLRSLLGEETPASEAQSEEGLFGIFSSEKVEKPEKVDLEGESEEAGDEEKQDDDDDDDDEPDHPDLGIKPIFY